MGLYRNNNGILSPIAGRGNIDGVYRANGILGAKNLLPNTAITKTVNGITFTVNADGTITANGTATGGNASLQIMPWGEKVIPEGNIIISDGGASFSGASMHFAYKKGASGAATNIFLYSNHEASYTIDYSQADTFYCGIYVNENVTLNNVVYKPMIRLASDTDSTYQSYSMTNKELTELAEIKTYRDATTGVRFIKSGRVVTVTFEQTGNYLWNVAEGGLLMSFPSGFELVDGLGSISWREPLNNKRLGLSNTSSLKGIVAMEALENVRLRGGFTYITN